MKEAADTEDGHEQTDEQMLLARDPLTGWEFIHYPYANPSKPPYLHPYMVSKGGGEYYAFSPKISWSEAWDEWEKIKADARRKSTDSDSGSENRSQNNGAESEKIREIILRCMPKDTRYYTFDFEIDDEEIQLHCNGTEKTSSLSETSCKKIDLKVISKMEDWVKKIDKLLPDLNASFDLGTDWFSGMSVGGEGGPFTYDGFTYTIDTSLNESLNEKLTWDTRLQDYFSDDYQSSKLPDITFRQLHQRGGDVEGNYPRLDTALLDQVGQALETLEKNDPLTESASQELAKYYQEWKDANPVKDPRNSLERLIQDYGMATLDELMYDEDEYQAFVDWAWQKRGVDIKPITKGTGIVK